MNSEKFEELTEEEKNRRKEIAFRFAFRRLSDNQKKALKKELNQTILWATSGVD